MTLYSSTYLSQSEPMDTPYTVEEIIAELTRIAKLRGWGFQSTTNILDIKQMSGQRPIYLLHGNEPDVEKLEKELESAREKIDCLESKLLKLERQRDSIRRAVDRMREAILDLKEEVSE